ncbi:GDSL esterase/lipase At5g45910-like [Malania oleifera]|uniref:GDSL esterase/lipase At5g45910-like n=1 Tax=Malania oleifera TaxID=397392 RepID=UPI0025AE5F47|nr:GDSL esterase/lipase At5g45910-like [Malania oleifera]
MAVSKSYSLPLATFILFLSLSSSSAHNKPHIHRPYHAHFSCQGSFSKVYAFGDSYTDTGNALRMGGLKSLIGGFLSHTPFGSSVFNPQKGRLCDGRLVVDFLCEALSLPQLPPYKEFSGNFSSGVNFAIAGSTCLAAEFFIKKQIAHSLMWKGVPESYSTQINWYDKFLLGMDCKGKDERSCRAEMNNALFWIGAMGVNDYARILGSAISTRWLTDKSVGNVCDLVQVCPEGENKKPHTITLQKSMKIAFQFPSLYNVMQHQYQISNSKGHSIQLPKLALFSRFFLCLPLALLEKGAKYMVVQGLPPIGCLPSCLQLSPSHDRDNLGCASGINSAIKTHNELLQRKLAAFQKQYPGCSIIYADYWNAYRAILMNATKYNFDEPFKTCCGAGGGPFNCDLNLMCGALGTSTCSDPSKHMVWDGIHLTEAMYKHLTDLFLYKGYCKPSFEELIRKKKRMM